jgi:hypothetical protein
LLASSLAPPKLYAQLRESDPAEVAIAEKQAKKLRNFCKVQAKIEFLERRQQMEQRSLAVKRHGLELLRQDAARLANILFLFLFFFFFFLPCSPPFSLTTCYIW